MLRLLVIIIFLITASSINAEHLDAFLWIDNWRDHRLKTDKNKDMYNMKQDNTIYYYYKAFLREPSCSINIQNNKIDDPGVGDKKGDDYNDKICIESYSTLYYFKIHDNESKVNKKCEWTSYETSSAKIIDTTASCNNYGCLTRFGWVYKEYLCDNSKTPKDNNWMCYLDPSLKLNQINIPGTHDSGTYTVETGEFLYQFGADLIRKISSRTQALDITQQLEAGIRYLDLRLENEDNKIYLTHNGINCYNEKTGGLYYLSDVFDEIIQFLNKYNKETVIVHLKKEEVHLNDKELANIIANYTINNENKVPFNKYILYKDFYYNNTENDEIPRLSDAQGKIVILSRENYLKHFGRVGITFEIPGMGSCDIYKDDYKDIDCYPILVNITNNYIYRIQDGYNLGTESKINVINAMLNNDIPSRTACININDFYNKSNDKSYANGYHYVCDGNDRVVIFNNLINNRFYDPSNENTLTVDFANVAIASILPTEFAEMSYNIIAGKLDNLIESAASDINYQIINFNGSFYNHWFVLDFPSSDVIRKIYLKNRFKSSSNNNLMNNLKLSTNNLKLSASNLKSASNNFNFSNDDLMPSNYFKDLNIYFDNNYYIYKKPNNETKLCIQLKLRNNKKNKNYVVKTNFECVNNSRNQWYFEQNNDSFNIVSVFDNKCLLYKNNNLIIGECDNDYKDFIINNKTICSKVNKKNCLDGYKIMSVPLERKQYQNLDCQKEIVKLGYQCCSNSVEIEYTDEIGTWGYENGEKCGIPFDTLDLQEDVD